MSHLTRNDYAAVLALLARLEPLAGDPRFLEAVLDEMAGFVASERASLAVCDLVSGQPMAPPAGFVASVPLAMDGCRLMRLDLQRSHRDFSERDRARLALLQPHLAYLVRQSRTRDLPEPRQAVAPGWPVARTGGALTPREGDVMHWLACGKTDADIAALLAISPRTVHKHLEHIYEKLGVETRTAAVMALRRLTPSAPGGGP
jgi:DNA-binding NarL/FixJ family response regulator